MNWSPIADSTGREGYYLAVCAWVERVVRGRALPTAAVVGVNGPQGAGKSTLVDALARLLGARGLRAVAVSVDDFYLTHPEQRALAERHPGNPSMEFRGYPGTHDLALGTAVLDALRRGSGVAEVPVYDKGAHDGRGDRLPRERWRRVEGPVDLVLLEGWMLGFTPVADGAVAPEHLRPANEALKGYAEWHSRLDAMVHLDMASPEYVVGWRVDAERARRRSEGKGLTDDEARDYVERFLPAYALWVPGLRERPPVDGPALRVVLGPDRLPLPRGALGPRIMG